MTAGLIVCARLLELAFLDDEGGPASYARLPPWIARARDRLAVGAPALQLFALEKAEFCEDVLGAVAGLGPCAGSDLVRQSPEVLLTALLIQLRKDALRRAFEPGEGVTAALPDAVADPMRTIGAAAEAAGLDLRGMLPFSVAVALGSSRADGERLVCVVEDYAATLAVVDGDVGRRLDFAIVPGLGAQAQVAAVASILQEALGLGDGELPARRASRLRAVARETGEALVGDSGTAVVTLDIGRRVRQARIGAVEVRRRLELPIGELSRHARRLAATMVAPPRSVLLFGETRDTRWVGNVLREALPGVQLERASSTALAAGCARAAALGVGRLVRTAERDLSNARVGLFAMTPDGRQKFDVIFEPRDPRDRSVVRRQAFAGDATIELLTPTTEGGYDSVGAARFGEFDRLGWPLELQFARKGRAGFSVQASDPRTGRTITREINVRRASAPAEALAASAAKLVFLPPLPPSHLL